MSAHFSTAALEDLNVPTRPQKDVRATLPVLIQKLRLDTIKIFRNTLALWTLSCQNYFLLVEMRAQ